MSTVIDSLLVTLGLDSSGLKTGYKDASKAQTDFKNQTKKDSKERSDLDKKGGDAQKKQAQQIQDNAKKNAESIRQVRNQALSLAAVFMGGMGIAHFISSTLTTAAGVGRLSNNIGESIPTIIGFQRAFENVGGTADEATQALTKASLVMSDMKSLGQSTDFLNFIHAGGVGEASQFDTALKFMLAKADLLKKTSDEQGAPAALQKANMMGMSMGEFNLLKQGSGAVLSQVNAQGQLAGITAKTAKESADLEIKLNTLKHKFEDVGRTALLALIPTFEKLLPKLNEFADWIESHKGDISAWLSGSGDKVGGFIGQIEKLTTALGGLKTVLLGIGAISFANFGVIGKTISAIVALMALNESSMEAGKEASKTPGGEIKGNSIGDWFDEVTLDIKAISGNKEAQELLIEMAKMGNKRAEAIVNRHGKFIDSSQSHPAQNAASNVNKTSNNDTKIDTINIHTQATNADDISKSIAPALKRNSIVPQANTGAN